MVRGVRGAITVEADTRDAILQATSELLGRVVDVNGIDPEEVASVYFTTTPDLVSEFPAVAAREMGWTTVPLMCGHEMATANALKRCIRILILWNTEKPQAEIHHLYLREAASLRRDLSGGVSSKSS